MKRILTLIIGLLVIGDQTSYAQDATTNDGFYNPASIQDINISFEQDNWSYLLDSMRLQGGNYLIGTVDINGETYRNVGIRWQASRAFKPGSKRNGIDIKLDYINRSQKIAGHGDIKLSTATRDPSFVREVLGYEIARNYMPAPKANYARAKFNKEFYGLFVNVETVDKAFLKHYFGSYEHPFFEVNTNAGLDTPDNCKNNLFGSLEYEENVNCYLNNFNMLSSEGWDGLIELTKILNETPEAIDKILDVDETLWMLAFNSVIVNLDSYTGSHKNYYLYQDANGQFHFILGDLNFAFGSFKNTGLGSDLDLKKLQTLNPVLHIDNPYKPLINQLLKNDLNKKKYLSHMREIYRTHFFNDSYLDRVKTFQSLIADDFVRDEGQRYTKEDLENSLTETIGKRSKIPGIQELMGRRAKFLSKNSYIAPVPPTFKSVNVAQKSTISNLRMQDFRITATLDRSASRVKILYRFDENEPFQIADLKDNGQNDDGTPNDGTFGIIIIPEKGQKDIEYYLWSDNATMISFSPANYMWEKHTANLDALNQ